MYLHTFWTRGIEGTDKTVGSRDDLQPSSLELRHHVVMLKSKHGSSRRSIILFVLPPTSHTSPFQLTPSKWLTAPYIRLLYCREYDRHHASARISSNEMQMPLAEHMPPPTCFMERRDFKIRWVLIVFAVLKFDIPVSSALGYKGALPLLEMHEDREHRSYNNDYVPIFLAVLSHEFSNPSLPLIHMKASRHLCK